MMRPLLSFTFLVSCLVSSQAQTEGIFATFQTSAGAIRAQLFPDEAPVAVSNFIGLVEGSQVAIEAATGQLIEGDYYNGVTFHRVIENFMIQAGSPDGSPAGGPGYSFQDEFDPTRTFAEPFMLAMANAGPNTNGSQFFITVAETSFLDNIHTIFGKVVEGSNVATAISMVATDADDRPLEAVVIESISIERVGAAAEAFVLDLEGLPKVRQLRPSWEVREGRHLLDVSYETNAAYLLYLSSNLTTWREERIGFFGSTLPNTGIDVTAFVTNQPQGFFRVVEVDYPVVVFPPPSLIGNTLDTLILRFAGGNTESRLVYTFTSEASGTATFLNRDPVAFGNYSYRVDGPTRATLVVPSNLPVPFNLPQFVLNFRSATTGAFSAVLPNAFPQPAVISGTFTLNES